MAKRGAAIELGVRGAARNEVAAGVLLAGMLLAVLAPARHAQVSPDSIEGPASTCSLRETARRSFSLGDRALYVEAHTVGFVHGRMLIVGQPVFEWFVAADGRRTLDSYSRILGVLVGDDASGSTTEAIGFPDGVSYVGWARGVALDASRWGFVMQEIDGVSVAEANAKRVLYAEYEFEPIAWRDAGSGPTAGSWGPVETIVDVGELRDAPISAGPLQRDPMTGQPVWTALVRKRPGIDAVTFDRTSDGWTSTVAFPDWADDAATRIESDGTRRVAVAGLDPDFDHQLASIRIEAPTGAAQSKRLDVGLLDEQIRSPVFSGSDDGDPDLAWITRSGQGTSVRVAEDMTDWSTNGLDARGMRRAVVLDPSADAVQYAGVLDGASVWVTRHVSTFMGDPTLRVLQLADEGPRAIGSLAYPFLGDFVVLPESPGTFSVIGPDVDMAPFTPSVRSLLIRLSIDCT